MSFLLASGEGGGFEAPGPADFWQPLAGGDSTWAITRPMILALISMIVIVGTLLLATRRLSVVPTKGQWMTEAVYSMVRNGVARDVIGSREFLRWVPLLFSLFLYILVNNLFGIVPFLQFPTMSRIGFPAGIAILVFIVYHVVGMKSMGVAGYFKHMVPPGLPKAIVPLIFFLELVTYFFTRPVTLALRLFGNMFAGHILLLLRALGAEHMLFGDTGAGVKVAGVAVYAGGFVMTLFEAFVEFLQAYVFTLLSALYIAGSIAADHTDHH